MALGDAITIEERAEGYLVQLTFQALDSQDIRQMIEGFLGRPEAPFGTLQERGAHAAEQTPENVVPFGHQQTAVIEEEEEGPEIEPWRLEAEYQNLARLNQFVLQGAVPHRDETTSPFTIDNWYEGLAKWCPHIDLKEAEVRLGEYLAENDDYPLEELDFE